jgi:hypothetical protein
MSEENYFNNKENSNVPAEDVNNVQDPKLNRRQSSSFFADAT